MATKRVLISGGRYFNLSAAVHEILSAIHASHGIVELVEGGATGADELGKLWACANNIPVRTFEANWKLFGTRAGSIRNSAMLREFKPNLAVVFPGGNGTADMRRKLIEAGVPTFVGTYAAGSDETRVNWSMIGG